MHIFRVKIVIAIAQTAKMFQHHARIFYTSTFAVFALLLCMQDFIQPSFAQQDTIMPQPITRTDNNATFARIAQIFGSTPAFDNNRSAEQVRAACIYWNEPATTDEQSRQWYRAATTLNAIHFRTIGQHQQMLILYEAAARRGHYLAIKNLTIIYTDGALVQHGRFMPEPAKARAWIEVGLEQQWPGALEWVANAVINGNALFPSDRQMGLAYMQHAANLGVALAQYQLSKLYSGMGDDTAKERAFLECAAQQRLSAAQDQWGIVNQAIGKPQEALHFFQQAIMNGGETGGEVAFSLIDAFDSESNTSRKLQTPNDPIRQQAYRDLKTALIGDANSDGNIFLRFPYLNDVLPLPPAKIAEWNGIYSAMAPDDAKYYQNPPPATYYIEQIRLAGYLIPQDYLSKPTPK